MASSDIARGIAKQVRYKKEVTLNTLPGATGANLLRRVTSSLDLQKDTYQSQEIRSDQQIADFRHGINRVAGDINGELSLGGYNDFWAAILRKAWTNSVTTGSQTTIAASAGTSKFTWTAGTFMTNGFKIGMTVRVSGAGAGANANKNFLITAITETDITVSPAPATVASGTATTIASVGKHLWVPTSGQTDDSFAIEHYFPGTNAGAGTCEVFGGCKVNSAQIQLPPTGMATVGWNIMGLSMTNDPNGNGTAPYFTSPSPAPTGGVLAAVNGSIRVAGTQVATVTGLQFNIAASHSGDPVVGSNGLPDLFQGRVNVTGQLTAYYRDGSLVDAFRNETEISLIHSIEYPVSGGPNQIFNIILPRIKLGGATKDDGEKGLIQTVPFQALLNTAGSATGASHQTTIMIQDELGA